MMCFVSWSYRKGKVIIPGGMILEVYSYSCAGTFHAERNMPNEDCVATLKNDNLVVSVVTDGAGGKKAGKEAAQLLAPDFAEWIFSTFQELYCRKGDYVRAEAVRIIDSLLKAYAQSHGYEENDLACTLMASAIDSEGRCFCIHLGDGIVLRRMAGDSVNSAEVVSPPENGLTSQETFLSMNCNMWRHIRYCRWKDPKTDCIISLSDGAQTHIAKLENTEGWSINTSCQLDAKSIIQYLINAQPSDDHSFAIISK